MHAVRPVFITAPDELHTDLEMGKGQEEYNTLPVTAIRRQVGGQVLTGDYFVSLSRWRLTDEERGAIAAGADIVHQVIHPIGAYPPMHLQIVGQDEQPVVVST